MAHSVEIDGREASRARRRALSLGKAALPQATERVRGGSPVAAHAPAIPAAPPLAHDAGRNGSGARVTGVAMPGAAVTGNGRGAYRPISGTPAIGSEPARSTAPKVGYARTGNGLVVSGTLVRSSVRVTGDEAGAGAAITGEADQRPEDDLTDRSEPPFAASSRPRTPTGFGHAAWGAGSRARTPEARVREATAGGLPVTGIALAQSVRVTGDEAGACRRVTGNDYLTPARFQAACGGPPAEAAAPAPGSAERSRITGSFAIGDGKVTGNREFGGSAVRRDDAPPAHTRVSGEGRANGVVTGGAWSEHPIARGTEGAFASSRNPSRRAGKPQAFSGSRNFAALASREEPKRLVTGMFGYSSETAAKVTLSGGAQG